jgi:hypothetical protein
MPEKETPMVRVSVFTNEIAPDGELVDHLAATFQVNGQELEITEGDPRFVQMGMPVYSDRYDEMIDFDTDGEEWARNLPRAYRNGALTVQVAEVPAWRETLTAPAHALARAVARMAR